MALQIDSGTLAKGSPGSATFLMNLSFIPEILIFAVSGKFSADTEAHIAIGWDHGLDSALQASAGKSSETRGAALIHYAGTTKKIEFTVTAKAAGQFTLNFTFADVNYNIHYLAIAA